MKIRHASSLLAIAWTAGFTLTGCSPQNNVSDACYIRIGSDYCLPKGTVIEVANISEDSVYRQVLRFPNYTGETGQINVSYNEESSPSRCRVEEEDVIVAYRNLEATCLNCKPWFEEFPTNYAAEIRTVDSENPLFQPCHKMFTEQASSAE